MDGQGISSLQVTCDAIMQTSANNAIAMLDNYWWEVDSLFQGYIFWLVDWMDDIRQSSGPDVLWQFIHKGAEHIQQYFSVSSLPIEAFSAFVNQEAVIHRKESGLGNVLVNVKSGEQIPLSPWKKIGKDIDAKIRSAILENKRSAAAGLMHKLHAALKPVHDPIPDLCWLWMTLIAQQQGEQALYDLMIRSGERMRGRSIKAIPTTPVLEQVLTHAAFMRGHRSGPEERGDIKIVEDDEKYVMEFDACGSGGRMRRRSLDGLPPRQSPPFNFGTTSASHPMGWGRTDVPYYCTHCSVWSEIMTTDSIGYPARITLFDPDGTKPCAWVFYKRPEDIPEEYFTRIGRKRDPARIRASFLSESKSED